MNKKLIAILVIISLVATFSFWRYQSASKDADIVVEENLENNELEEMINKKTE